MHPVVINAFRDRLLKRRAQVLTTIGYLQSEKRAVEMNTEWKDPREDALFYWIALAKSTGMKKETSKLPSSGS
jgi:hypothetical protein